MQSNRSRGISLAWIAVLLAFHANAHAAHVPGDLAGPWRLHSIATGPGAPWWERARLDIAPNGAFTAYSTSNTGSLDTLQATLQLGSTGILSLVGSSTFQGALDLGGTVLVATDTWGSGAPGTTELKFGVKPVGIDALAQLAGSWEINSIASGAGAPWWERGRITIAGDGSFSGTLVDNLGASDPVSGSFGMNPDGTLTFAGSPTALGALDAGRTVLALNSTWAGSGGGTVDQSVGVRMAASYTIADLAGTWEIHTLASGPGAPAWSRLHLTVAANGSYSGTGEESGGGSEPQSGSFAITPQGVLSRSGSVNGRGVLDAGKTVMVWTDTWTSGSPGTAEVAIGVRTGGATVSVPSVPAPQAELAIVPRQPVHGSPLTVRFSLAGAGSARLDLLDPSGRIVESRDLSSLGAGRHEATLAKRPRPGVYWLRLREGDAQRSRRVVVL